MKFLGGRSRAVATAVVLAFLASVAAAQNDPHYAALPNFHKVNDQLYRGGQPGGEGIKQLAKLGIKTIINLRGTDQTSTEEGEEAKAAGLNYVSLPMSGVRAPSDVEITKAMAAIDDPKDWPVFVHCRRGSDRTGTIVALYRIEHDGWTDGRALKEAKQYGMSWVEFGMRGYITQYYRHHNSIQRHAEPAQATD